MNHRLVNGTLLLTLITNIHPSIAYRAFVESAEQTAGSGFNNRSLEQSLSYSLDFSL